MGGLGSLAHSAHAVREGEGHLGSLAHTAHAVRQGVNKHVLEQTLHISARPTSIYFEYLRAYWLTQSRWVGGHFLILTV